VKTLADVAREKAGIFRRGRPDWGAAKLAAVFLVFMVLVSGLQTVPAYEYGKLARRWVGTNEPKAWNEIVPYSVHSEYSLIPTSLLSIVVPGFARHADPFMGVTALSLALLAVAMAWREFPVKIFAAVGAGGLLFSLGRNDVFQGILYALVPMVEKARSPSMAIFIYHFGIAVLTAYGIDYILSGDDSPWPRRTAICLAALGVLLFTILGVLVLGQKPPGEDRFVVVALVSLLLAWLLQGWRGRLITQTTAAVLALGLMLIEFGNSSGMHWPNEEEKARNALLRSLTEDSDLAAFLVGVPWLARVEISDEDIPYNFGDWYGIDQFGGYVASLPVNLLDLPWNAPHAQKLFGVNFVVRRGPPGPGQVEVFQSARGLKVYWNADAFPRVWAVHEAQRVRQRGQVGATLSDTAFDLRRKTILLEPPPALEACPASDDVRLTRRNSGRVTIEADMGCRGMVVLGDSYFPGWSATVDGKRVNIYEALAMTVPGRPRRAGFAARLQRKHGLSVACFGHAGDGNIHTNVMVDFNQPGAKHRSEAALDELFTQVLAWGGSITGEHGIGLAKQRWWPLAVSKEVRALHRTVKRALDPRGILNPGKFV